MDSDNHIAEADPTESISQFETVQILQPQTDMTRKTLHQQSQLFHINSAVQDSIKFLADLCLKQDQLYAESITRTQDTEGLTAAHNLIPKDVSPKRKGGKKV